ncbi:hypothetical protein Pan44_06530 [Caulifigura coniformis]|uniref:Uncharacterized protein n=1 Tax=Caulifigura coniformis TaxID=2527983 RepID=A0A517S933_9PLAN|nr:hypothetical protein [Caulifigura coniformis]QDT52641.1 hypothetical protein Pan44_06530 [Caulifigura coniformis]
MSAVFQVAASIWLGTVSYLIAAATAFYDNPVIFIPIQMAFGAAFSAIAVLVIAPIGITLRMLPFQRRLAAGFGYGAIAIVSGFLLIAFSGSDWLATRVSVDGIVVRELEPISAISGWVLVMLAPFLVTAGRSESQFW